MAGFTVIVPARMGAKRLPGKPLADLGGKPVLVRVLERAQAAGAKRVIAAVNSAELVSAVEHAGFEALLTGDCANGTERIAEAATRLNIEGVIVNVQGDEPFVDPNTIARCASLAAKWACATAATPASAAEATDPEVVKVVCDHASRALFFSRSAIPYRQSSRTTEPPTLLHLGLYAFKSAAYLRTLCALPACAIEHCEGLEQLRWLWHGQRIDVIETNTAAAGINTAADLERARQLVARA